MGQPSCPLLPDLCQPLPAAVVGGQGPPAPPMSRAPPQGTGGFSTCDPPSLAYFCLFKFLNCIWSLVTNAGKCFLGVGGIHLPGPEMGSTEAGRLGTPQTPWLGLV